MTDSSRELLTPTDRGLYCADGDFYIDPEAAVDRAVITHAHGDHARPVAKRYLTARPGKHLVRMRVGARRIVEGIEYGQRIRIGSVEVSFHPAGHLLGSAQIRVERRGEVWVVSGDYKLDPDPTCLPFEPVRCDVFVTEATFARPGFVHPPGEESVARLAQWYLDNRAAGRASVFYGYPVGKCQRVLASLALRVGDSLGVVYAHSTVGRANEAYRRGGVELPAVRKWENSRRETVATDALVLAPPQTRRSRFDERFGVPSRAHATGWLEREELAGLYDLVVPLSDHADWPGTLEAIRLSGARRVWVTHGKTAPLVEHLRAEGLDARAIANRWDPDVEDSGPND